MEDKNMWQCFLYALKKYADLNGRATRKEYWSFIFIIQCILIPQYSIIVIAYYFFDISNTKSDLINIFVGIVFLMYCATCAFFFIPRIAVTVRRLHDTNHKSWWMWVPGYNLVLLCRRGNDSDNRFDFTPKPMGTSSIGNSQHMETEPVMPVVPLTHGSLDFLEKLGRLREKGIITEEEFQEQKRKIL